MKDYNEENLELGAGDVMNNNINQDTSYYDDANKDETSVSDSEDSPVASFSNMSTKDYMNMMAGQSSYNNTDNYSANYGYYDYAHNQTQNQNMGFGYTQQPQYNCTQTGYGYGQFVQEENNQKSDKKKKKKEKKSNLKATKIKKSGNSDGKVFLKKAVAFAVLGLVFGVAAGGAFTVITNFLDKDNSDGLASSEISATLNTGTEYDIPGTSVIADNQNDSGSLDVSDIAEAAMPSVVSITIKSIQEYNAGFFGQTYEYESEGSGSGIIIGENDKELLIVTNNHVVSDADTVTVSFIDNEVYEAKVKGTDSSSDLAVIVVNLEDLNESTLSQIKIATIGNSNDLKVGEQVVAIGNALGYGQSVTTGIISAKDRTNDTNSTTLIQTDAAINPGNSGGALLNMNGEVIGINQSKYADTTVEGMGYAIPVTEVEDVITKLMNKETRDKVDEAEMGYLGVEIQTVSEEASYMYGMPVGVLVVDYTEDSMAKKAGLKKNSIITAIDGQTVTDAQSLIGILEYYKAGETVAVTFMYIDDDEYKEKNVDVTLGKRPQ